MFFILYENIFENFICDDPIFPPHICALRSESNTVEPQMLSNIFIHILNKIFTCHIHIIFLNVLLDVQDYVYIKNRNVGTTKARKRTLIRNEYILNEIQKYEKGNTARFEFVKYVTYY